MDTITDASGMFSYHEDFNQNLSWWDTSSVTNMSNTFRGAKVFDQDISSWDTSSVTNMDRMFNDSKVFNQDISTWCVPLIESRPNNFSYNATAAWKDDYARQPGWGTCPPKILTNPVIG